MTDGTPTAPAAHAEPAWKLPPLEPTGYRSGCLNCGTNPTALPITTPLAVGFGFVYVTKDDETVWAGDDFHVWLRRFENRAAKDPDHDWRVTFNGPLSKTTYQRHGDREWVLVKRGMGFA